MPPVLDGSTQGAVKSRPRRPGRLDGWSEIGAWLAGRADLASASRRRRVWYNPSGSVVYAETISAGTKAGVSPTAVYLARPTTAAGSRSGVAFAALSATLRPTAATGLKPGIAVSPAALLRPSTAAGLKAGASFASFVLLARPTAASGLKAGATSVVLASGGLRVVAVGLKPGLSAPIVSVLRPSAAAGLGAGVAPTTVYLARPAAVTGLKAGLTSVVVAAAGEPTIRMAVHSILTATSSLTSLVASRIWPAQPIQGWDPTAGPCLVHEVVAQDFSPDLDGTASTAVADVEVQALASTLDQAEALQVLMLAELPRRDALAAGLTIDAVLVAGEASTFEVVPDGTDAVAYGVVQSFTFLYRT
jgi:hypothetical protein